MLLSGALSLPAGAEDYFNLRSLETDTPLANTGALEAYLHNNGLTAGRYLTTIYWDQDNLDKREINYVMSADKRQLIPQLTKEELRELGLKVDTLPSFNSLREHDIVKDISLLVPGAHYDFNPSSQILRLQIAQIYRNTQAVGDTNPKKWDEGMPAAWLNYYLSGSRQSQHSSSDGSRWASLNSGINLGAWRVRNNSTWGDDEGWQSTSTTFARDIQGLKSQLEVGQTATSGELFDSVQMTGIKLETDTSMLPSSQQGFAPVVRGIANSDAKVTVKQNGYTIYQTYVSAGPFEIKDLSQVTAGADLEVTVTEADGSERSFIQASSSVPIMQREGALKYSVSAGKYRDDDSNQSPAFTQATMIYGLPYGLTVYGGWVGATQYQSVLAGIGADLHQMGSFSLDMTVAKAAFDDEQGDESGASWRAQYAKDFPQTNTTVTLASYRYSTSGFYTFQEAVDRRQEADSDDDGIYSYQSSSNRRSRLQLNLSQSIGEFGSIYANAYQQDYWNVAGHERSASFGYSSGWQGINWSLNYSLTKTPYSESDRQMSLTINIPLSRGLNNAWATYSVNSARQGNTSHQVGVSGTMLEGNNLNYNLQQSYTDNNVGSGGYLSARYRASAGDFSSAYSYQKGSRQWNYSAQGSLVAHSEGITLGRSIQDAFAVVHIDDGAGVTVQNAQGLQTDAWGNAIVPMLTSYRHNTITVNTQGQDDLDIQDATIDIVPTRGAVVPVNFSARAGKRALLTLSHRGAVVPFGAILSLDGTTAIVGDGGEVYVTGLKGALPFNVQWGDSADQKCSGQITLPANVPAGILKLAARCQ